MHVVNKIKAIKATREKFGTGLLDSKLFVESFIEGNVMDENRKPMSERIVKLSDDLARDNHRVSSVQIERAILRAIVDVI